MSERDETKANVGIKRGPNLGRVRFLARRDLISGKVGQGYPLSYIYAELQVQLKISYSQFARYVGKYIRLPASAAPPAKAVRAMDPTVSASPKPAAAASPNLAAPPRPGAFHYDQAWGFGNHDGPVQG
jgi:hypothetical protein